MEQQVHGVSRRLSISKAHTGETRGSRTRFTNLKRSGYGLALPLAIVVLWQLAAWSGSIDPLFVPAPMSVADASWEQFASGELLDDMAISLRRAAIGFLIGGGLGTALGVITGFSKVAARLIDPSLQVIRLTPTLAIAPLLVLWFGFGETSKIVLIASLAFFPLYLNAFQGVRSIDTKLVEVTKVLEFSVPDSLRLAFLPAAAPHLFTGLRLSLAVSWIGLIVAEITGSNSGIGHMIVAGQTQNRTDIVFLGIAVFAIMGWLIDVGVSALQSHALRWHTSFQA
jgi:sulfonate transport system permease protein